MLITGFPAGPWGTNCYVVATGVGEECFIVDPGKGASKGVADIVSENRLKPVAVVLTHGHIDHTWSVIPVCETSNVPAFIHPGDRYMLADPLAGISGETRQAFASMNDGTLEFREPNEVLELGHQSSLTIAGIDMEVEHAPGHTPGSMVFRIPESKDEDRPPVAFTGDFIFQGSIGRTDLPGGNSKTIMESLRDVVLPLDDATVLLPGHGSTTTVGDERASNPFLLQVQADPHSDLNMPKPRGL